MCAFGRHQINQFFTKNQVYFVGLILPSQKVKLISHFTLIFYFSFFGKAKQTISLSYSQIVFFFFFFFYSIFNKQKTNKLITKKSNILVCIEPIPKFWKYKVLSYFVPSLGKYLTIDWPDHTNMDRHIGYILTCLYGLQFILSLEATTNYGNGCFTLIKFVFFSLTHYVVVLSYFSLLNMTKHYLPGSPGGSTICSISKFVHFMIQILFFRSNSI